MSASSQEYNDTYVIQLEVTLATAFRIGPKDGDSKRDAEWVPSHFYGELVKTAEGRMILEAKGHFQEFADFIRAHGMEDEDLELIAKLKSVLWAVVRYFRIGHSPRTQAKCGCDRATLDQMREASYSSRTKTSYRTLPKLLLIPVCSVFGGERFHILSAFIAD